MALSKEVKTELVAKYGSNDKDTGSVKVQIALLTKEIDALTLHLKNNQHDGSSRRGLLTKVGSRRSLLNYLAKRDPEGYASFIKELGIRK
jgi:small subunit ribosomal protein S15